MILIVSHCLKHSQPDFAELVLQSVGLLHNQCTSLSGFLRGPCREETHWVRTTKFAKDSSVVFGPELRANLHKEVTVLHCECNVLHSISMLHQMVAHLWKDTTVHFLLFTFSATLDCQAGYNIKVLRFYLWMSKLSMNLQKQKLYFFTQGKTVDQWAPGECHTFVSGIEGRWKHIDDLWIKKCQNLKMTSRFF